MGFGIKTITQPASEPVSLTEFKAQARVTSDDEDALHANIIIPAARQWCEKYTGRAFVTQTIRITLDYFPDCIEVLRPPLQSVSSVTYIDTAEDEQTLAAADYRVETDNEPGIIQPAYGTIWPVTLAVAGGVKVTAIVGYGGADDVPSPIKMGILMLAAHMNLHREAVLTGTIQSEIAFSVKALLSPYWTGLYCPTPEG